jgi:hypothetical protein
VPARWRDATTRSLSLQVTAPNITAAVPAQHSLPSCVRSPESYIRNFVETGDRTVVLQYSFLNAHMVN